MATMDEPPPLVDRVSNADGDVGIDNIEDEDELYEINAMLDDAMYNECEEGDEECEDEEEEDDEEDEDEEEEGDEDEWVDDGDEQSEYEDEDADEEDPIEIEKRLYKFHPSDENFKESDLEERKKRRFLIGQHSFYDLADPHLEDALDPLDLAAEEEGLETEEKKRRGLKAEKDFYKDMCKELGVTPDRKVLASLRELSMDLTGYGMNSKEIVALCKLLERNTHVEFLCLSGNAAGTEGGLALAELITNNETITTYELAGTEIVEAFEAICNAISQNLCVMHLNFSRNELEDIDMPHIKKILRETPLLRSLKLSGNRIKDNGLRQIGLGLKDNLSLELIDLSFNKIFGENNAGIFFTACADHPALRVINLRRNFIKDEGGKGVGRTLGNAQLEELDASFNLMEAASAQSMARGLGRHKQRAIKSIKLELQRFRQEHGAAILKPLANKKLDMPDFELLDFGFMLDIHTTFITAKEKALKVHPDLKIIHGLTYGLDHAKGPDLRQLVIRKADAVCTSFETTLVMLMEELAKEKKELTVTEFRKFIKQCNLYKDKSVTEAFEKVFEKPGTGFVDAVAILEAFDKEYPGKRFIPEPVEEEEMEEKPKEEKKKKGKGKGKGKGKDKGKGKEKDKKGGKGKKK